MAGPGVASDEAVVSVARDGLRDAADPYDM